MSTSSRSALRAPIRAVAQPDKPVQHLDRLRTGRMITSNDDQIRSGDIRFG
jgi:hypothetical protein